MRHRKRQHQGYSVHILVDGQIDTPPFESDPKTLLAPEAIAETYWQLCRQDPPAWTLELDLRPALESF